MTTRQLIVGGRTAQGSAQPDEELQNVRVTASCDAGYLDRTRYRTVHFHGASLHETLMAASIYLRRLEEKLGHAPHILCVHDEFSDADAGTELTWQFTVILGEPQPN